MFKEDFYTNGTLNVIKLIKKFCKKNKIECYFVIVPTYYDLKYIKNTRNDYYQVFIDKCQKNKIKILNPLNKLIDYNCDSIYSDKAYGGHLNENGNKILANYINTNLK